MLDHGKVLVIAPHTDDGELGCGGTMAKLTEEGRDVFYVAFSICEESVPEPFPKDILATEVMDATSCLGVPESNVIIKRYPVRHFPTERQAILQDLVSLREELQPDLIFCPSWHALHQDHRTVAEEALRAFKRVSLLGYDMPWDVITFSTTAFFTLEERHIDKKIASLKHYKSQQHRDYVSQDEIRGLAWTRGAQIQADFAEAFEVMRLVV